MTLLTYKCYNSIEISKKKEGDNVKKWIACLLVCCAIASLSGCKKDTITPEQKKANLEQSSRELEEFAKKSKENLERVKQQNQEYLDAYAKASGK